MTHPPICEECGRPMVFGEVTDLKTGQKTPKFFCRLHVKYNVSATEFLDDDYEETVGYKEFPVRAAREPITPHQLSTLLKDLSAAICRPWDDLEFNARKYAADVEVLIAELMRLRGDVVEVECPGCGARLDWGGYNYICSTASCLYAKKWRGR